MSSDTAARFKILIIDDEVPFQQICVAVIGKRGAEVISAYTPEEALRLFDEHHGSFDVIAVDACLGSGFDTASLIQSIRKEFVGPMIAISGNADYRKAMLQIGCSCECEKFNLPHMIHALIR